MSNDELIEAKSREITRLHKVCQQNDNDIREVVHFLQLLAVPESFKYEVDGVIIRLINILG